jgi:hypothetical protein
MDKPSSRACTNIHTQGKSCSNPDRVLVLNDPPVRLGADKNYSIANECYPYVARRLLTDSSPQTRAALEQLLYGRDGPTAEAFTRALLRST